MAEIVEQRDDVLRCLSGHDYQGEANLVCPVCGFGYSHILNVRTALGSGPVEAVVYPGTIAQGAASGRRSALVIELEGECGHNWNFIIQQHKGINLLQIEISEK